jgi:uncharacterized OB-fold protein
VSVSDGPLLPRFVDENRPFWEGARQGELRVQRCRETGRLIFPPRLRSPWAPKPGVEPEWTAVSGRGTLWSFVVPHPPLLPYYAERVPYNVIVVALDEDPSIRMVGNLIAAAGCEINSVDPATIEIGAALRVVFERVDDEIHLPRWLLA